MLKYINPLNKDFPFVQYSFIATVVILLLLLKAMGRKCNCKETQTDNPI